MSVELYDKYIHVPRENLNHKESILLLGKMEEYVNGTIIQFNRIQSTQMNILGFVEEMKQCSRRLEDIWKIEDSKLRFQKLEEYNKEKHDKFKSYGVNNLTLFLDIHFYLICFDKVQNLIEKLAYKENNENLSILCASLLPKFKPYNDMRNNLEHIEDRTKPKYTTDFGNLNNGKFTFGGKELDISQDSLSFICNSYEQVLECIS
ncbi:hypothetical protein RSJ42_05905 [Methanosarcina hadiensis]|uniref:hypothetical protein n=1 Tax=Methanosarcina hadiensis TaxID=3078083 RepID=UPI003977B217